MKAVVFTGYGGPDVVQIQDVPEPIPADDEVLIRVRAAAANPHDWRVMRGSPFLLRPIFGGFRAPKHGPGRDVAGDVVAVGKNTTRLKTGDAVFGFCYQAFAEYACTRESRLAKKPDNVTYEQAASVPVAGLTAIQALRDKGGLRVGQKVLINGAAGGVGSFAVQIAKAIGAEVTGVCSSANVDLVRSIGADHVVDYTHTDYIMNGKRYDLVIDCVGNHAMSAHKRVLEVNGTCVIVGAPKHISALQLMRYLIEPKMLSRFGRQKFVTFITKANDYDLPAIAELMKEGKVRPVIDSCYPLNEAAAAIARVETGHARGKVVIVPTVG